MSKQKILNLIKKEKNSEKRRMLHQVYNNNLRYADTKEAIGMLGNVIHAMNIADRKFFVPESMKSFCYNDEALEIGHEQTISQPTTVARMILFSKLKKGMDILEIGSGSGWNASIMSLIVHPGTVVSTERIKELKENAERNFGRMYKKIKQKANAIFVYGDALKKNKEVWKRKYDRIISTAGVGKNNLRAFHNVGTSLLKDKGLMVYPTHETGVYGSLEVWKLYDEKLKKILREEGYAFVPLLKGED